MNRQIELQSFLNSTLDGGDVLEEKIFFAVGLNICEYILKRQRSVSLELIVGHNCPLPPNKITKLSKEASEMYRFDGAKVAKL
jgi:hypothetical protein